MSRQLDLHMGANKVLVSKIQKYKFQRVITEETIMNSRTVKTLREEAAKLFEIIKGQ